MATIVTKNSSTAASVPLAAQLTKGELAVNVTDKRVFTKDNSGAVVEVGTNPSAVSLPNGTANGVTYLNGSKALTSGTALTFDGSKLGVGTSSPIRKLVVSNSGAEGLEIGPGNSNGDTSGAVSSIYYNRSTSAYVDDIQNANTHQYQIAGSEAMRLTSTGLGIGTSSPATKLHASSAAGTDIRSQTTDTTNASATVSLVSANTYFLQSLPSVSGSAFRIFDGTAGAERLRLDSAGNLGIGTSSIYDKLEVSKSTSGGLGAVIVSTNAATAATGNAASIGFRTSASFLASGYYSARIAAEQEAGGIANTSTVFYRYSGATPSGVESMRLDSAGNLGLGVTPSAWLSDYKALQVSTYGTFYGRVGTNEVGMLQNSYRDTGGTFRYLQNGYGAAYTQLSGGGHGWFNAVNNSSGAGAALTFTQAMTLDASGNFGIGTSSPNSPAGSTQTTLHVNNSTAGTSPGIHLTNGDTGTAAGDGALIFVGNAASTGTTSLNVYNQENSPICFFTATAERARIDSSGNLLVGTQSFDFANNGTQIASSGRIFNASNTDYNFELGGSQGGRVRFYTSAGGSGTTVGSITVSTSATIYATSSDYRLKDNAQPLTGSGAFIDALQPKTWEWKVDGSAGVGFLAHEAQAVSPTSVVGEKDAVDEDGNPIMQAMEYGSAEFIANIVAELQSLRKRVLALEGATNA